MLTVKEIAERLAVPAATLRVWLGRHHIAPTVQIPEEGRLVNRYDAQAVEEATRLVIQKKAEQAKRELARSARKARPQ